MFHRLLRAITTFCGLKGSAKKRGFAELKIRSDSAFRLLRGQQGMLRGKSEMGVGMCLFLEQGTRLASDKVIGTVHTPSFFGVTVPKNRETHRHLPS